MHVDQKKPIKKIGSRRFWRVGRSTANKNIFKDGLVAFVLLIEVEATINVPFSCHFLDFYCFSKSH